VKLISFIKCQSFRHFLVNIWLSSLNNYDYKSSHAFLCHSICTLFTGIFGNTALEETFCGVAYNITSLYADLKIEEDTAQTARTLIQLLGSKEFGSKKVHYREAQCQQDAFTDFKYTLTKVLANREWTYEKVLERTRNTFTVPIANRVAPFLKIGTEKVANIFQVIILSLMQFIFLRSN